MTDASSIIDQLLGSGFSQMPQFLTPSQVSETRADLLRLKEEGLFTDAGIGKGAKNQVAQQVRKNELYWLERKAANAVQIHLWNELDRLKQALNQNLFLGIQDFEGHYTSYPPGGFYQRHLDSFSSDQKRIVSFILYLNQDWTPTQGGQLRIYRNDTHLDIEPLGGTLVCFLSREVEHEVLKSHANRYSFTGWFRSA